MLLLSRCAVCDFYVVTPFTLATLFMRQDFDSPIEVNVEPGSTHLQPVNDPNSCDTYMAAGSGVLQSFSSMAIEPTSTGTLIVGTWLYKVDLLPGSTNNMIMRLATRNAPLHTVSLNISMISVSGIRWTSEVTCSPDQTSNTLLTDSPTADTGATIATLATSSDAGTAVGSTTQPPTNNSDNTAIIVGGVIGGVAVIALAIAIALLLARRRRG